MKRIILLLALSCCIGCSAQRTEEKPLYKVVAFVDKVDGSVRLDLSHDSSVSYSVPDGEYVHNKEYVFWLDITDCKECRTRKAVVADYAITTGQAQRDQAAASKELSDRKIIQQ